MKFIDLYQLQDKIIFESIAEAKGDLALEFSLPKTAT
jgi:hypothetical protein